MNATSTQHRHAASAALQPAPGEEDPHLAGRRAQVMELRQLRALGRTPTARDLDDAYWRAYKLASQWGDL